jgi:uncharacterized protein
MGLQEQLTSAILGSQAARIASLLRRGAKVNAPDKYGTTPLYKASVQGETEIVQILLAAGADPNQEIGGADEGTPLCAAASWGRTEIVRLLLQHGADPNLIERGPMTALIWAQQNGHAEATELLLAAGADPRIDPRKSPGRGRGR